MAGFEQFGLTDEKMQKLLEISKDPAAREDLVARAAQAGPPPHLQQQLAPQPSTMPANVPAIGGAPDVTAPQQPAQTPVPQGDFEQNKSEWESMLDGITNPENPNSAIFKAGLAAMQPIQPGQTLGGHLAQSVGTGVESLTKARAGRKASERQAKLDKVAADKSDAQTKLLGAQTDTAERGLKSLDFEDDLTKSKAELNRANAKAAGKGSGVGAAKLALANIRVNAWYNANPGKFTNLDDARADLIVFDKTGGKTAYNDAMVSLLQDLPVWKADKLRPLLKIIKDESALAGERPTSPRQAAKDANTASIAKFTKEDWMRVASDPILKARVDKAFGKEKVDETMRGFF